MWNPINPFDLAIMEHHQNVDNTIEYLVDLYHDDIDITNPEILTSVFKKYQLIADGFEDERNYILQEVMKRI